MTNTDTSTRKPYIAPRVIHQGEDTPDAPFGAFGAISDGGGGSSGNPAS